MIRLAIRNNEEFREFSSEDAVLTIGRSLDNTLVLRDQKVSRRHARLEKAGPSYTITDLGSGNGTRVNGQLITEPRVVAKGDEIRVGVTTIIVLQMGTVPAAAPPMPPSPPSAPVPPPPSASPALPPPPAPSTAAVPPAPVPPPGPVPPPVASPPLPIAPSPPAAAIIPPPAPPMPPPAVQNPTPPSAEPAPAPNAPPAARARPPAPDRAHPSWLAPRRSPLKAGLIALASVAALAALLWGAIVTARLHKRNLLPPTPEREDEKPETSLPAAGAAETALAQFRAKVAAGPVNQDLIDEAAELSRRYSDAFPPPRYPSGSPFDRIHEELLVYNDVERLVELSLRDRRYEAALKALTPLKGITDPGVKECAEALIAKVDGEIARDFAEVEEEGRKLETERRYRDALQHYQTHTPRFQGTLFYKRLTNKPALLEAMEKAGAVLPPVAPAPAPPAPEPSPKD